MRPLTLKELQAINKKLRAELKASEIDIKVFREVAEDYENLIVKKDAELSKIKSNWVYKFLFWFDKFGK